MTNDSIEREEVRIGWAVVSGCEGEEMHFIAFFAARDRAWDYLPKCRASADDEFYLMDGDTTVVPACIDEKGTMLICNSYEEREVMQSMAEEANLPSGLLSPWLKELAPPMAECGSCRGYGHFNEKTGKPSVDRRERKCLDCRGEGKVPA